ncbi:MAG: gamma-glutamyl-phosphate reductase, partial [Candidatus Hydrogenedens sp.]|nr:gamma-glutamyl-phosphate reductase [Candidatus Hydrogenedens sp.]
MTLREELEQIGRQARRASNELRPLSRAVKDAALRGAAARLRASGDRLKAANAKDLAAGREKGLSAAMLDRLELTDARIEAMAGGLDIVAALPDPVGDIVHQHIHPNGLRIAQIRQP